jgi:hypothetical protein
MTSREYKYHRRNRAYYYALPIWHKAAKVVETCLMIHRLRRQMIGLK